ncbi:MAG: HIT domain-containing protein, partial [Actinomycetota bacterium]|nr:HIT domain-containing protein [Actinomycetota bacterium]
AAGWGTRPGPTPPARRHLPERVKLVPVSAGSAHDNAGNSLIEHPRAFARGHGAVTLSSRCRLAKSEQAMLLVPRFPRHDCLFCQIYETDDHELPWYDRALIRQGEVGVAVSAVGAFVPGYILVAPAQHESSVQALAADATQDFLAFVDRVVEVVEQLYGPSTLFEHGSCRAAERRRSACITHSHIHVVPGAYSFDLLGLPVRPLGSLAELVKIPAAERADGYLMYREPGGPVQYSPDAGRSQYFRRHIARMLGRPDEWDYALFPHWENVRATHDRFSQPLVRSLPLNESA